MGHTQLFMTVSSLETFLPKNSCTVSRPEIEAGSHHLLLCISDYGARNILGSNGLQPKYLIKNPKSGETCHVV